MEGRIEIPEEALRSLSRLAEEYGYSTSSGWPAKPPHGIVENHLMQFGVAEAATAASLILSAWPLFFPKDQRPKCPYSSRMSSRRCGAKIVHTSYDRDNQELIMVCEAHHETVQRKPRIYR